MDNIIVHVSYPIIFKYEGWIFEYSRNKPFGPWPLTKELEMRKRAGKKFYDMMGKFLELSVDEQNTYEV